MCDRRRALIWFWLVLTSACASGVTPTGLPTQALIPATAPPVVSTDDTLTSPSDLNTPAAGDVPLIPAAAQPLVQDAIEDLRERLIGDSAAIQLIRLESASWTSVELGCGTSTETVPTTPIVGYRIVLQAGETLYEYHSDGVEVRACAQPEAGDDATAESLMNADPVVAEMADLAGRMLVRDHDVAEGSARLVDALPVSWLDSSLGCPQTGVAYTPGHIDGYRLVVAVGDTRYIFHTDFDHLVECAAADEVLPPALDLTSEAPR